MKLASLFDGIGGFPLVATMLGIEPVWASEIEKFPIAVTKERFPNMKHLGSVCDIKGSEVEPVDIITFGSPCQDLSVAGKRAGMGEGTRSGLFSEAVRIIKEMRDARGLQNTNDVGPECSEGNNATTSSGGTQHGVRSNNGGSNGRYPRYAVWENVPGAFSSNKGEDFRAVVESLAKVAEEAVSIPLPKDGKWEPAGLVEGDGWSIAWRTLDAQFWGVPQRRKRIFLVADFGGDRASEIFFERESVFGNIEESGNEREGVTGGVEGGTSETICFEPRSQDGEPRIIGNFSPPLNTAQGGQRQPCVCLHTTQDPVTAIDRSHSLQKSGCQAVFDARGNGNGEVSPTITGDNQNRITDYTAILMNAEGSAGATLTAANLGKSLNNQTPLAVFEVANALKAKGNLSHRDGSDTYAIENRSVRRLTPLECERLQGFPDNWTNIPGASDSARYKALGNSVAIPCVKFILEVISR